MFWRLKICIKLALAYFKIPYTFLYQLGLSSKGVPNDFDLVLRKFLVHYNRLWVGSAPVDKTLLEIGFGDSLVNGMLFYLIGGSHSILVDVNSPKKRDLAYYLSFAAYASKFIEFDPVRKIKVNKCRSFEALSHVCCIDWSSEGLNALMERDIEVDFIISHSCLEHIPLDLLSDLKLLHERSLAANGVFSHNIDLQDHLTGGVNHLRFGMKFWESELVRRAGLYVNRVSYSDWVQFFNCGSLETIESPHGQHAKLPIARDKLHIDYAARTDIDLMIRTTHILGRRLCES